MTVSALAFSGHHFCDMIGTGPYKDYNAAIRGYNFCFRDERQSIYTYRSFLDYSLTFKFDAWIVLEMIIMYGISRT